MRVSPLHFYRHECEVQENGSEINAAILTLLNNFAEKIAKTQIILNSN